jgi:hypothetical protein
MWGFDSRTGEFEITGGKMHSLISNYMVPTCKSVLSRV